MNLRYFNRLTVIDAASFYGLLFLNVLCPLADFSSVEIITVECMM